jgi:hypothetical protein
MLDVPMKDIPPELIDDLRKKDYVVWFRWEDERDEGEKSEQGMLRDFFLARFVRIKERP